MMTLPSSAAGDAHDAAAWSREDGSVVAVHYGSVATELAICRKTAGLVDRSELGRLELTGGAPWMDHALAHAIGSPVPPPGSAVRLGDTWCCRVAADRATIVAPAPARARWQRLAREAVIAGDAVTCTEVTAESAAVSIVGPAARGVLRATGLPHDLALHGLSRGGLAGVGTTVLRDGPQQFLLLFGSPLSAAVWRALLDAGRPFGLSPVGSDALGRLRAAAPSSRFR